MSRLKAFLRWDTDISDGARRTIRTVFQILAALTTAAPVALPILNNILDGTTNGTALWWIITIIALIFTWSVTITAAWNKIEDNYPAIDEYMPKWLRRGLEAASLDDDEDEEGDDE